MEIASLITPGKGKGPTANPGIYGGGGGGGGRGGGGGSCILCKELLKQRWTNIWVTNAGNVVAQCQNLIA